MAEKKNLYTGVNTSNAYAALDDVEKEKK